MKENSDKSVEYCCTQREKIKSPPSKSVQYHFVCVDNVQKHTQLDMQLLQQRTNVMQEVLPCDPTLDLSEGF